MGEECYLVTGALGCIGSWTVKVLVDQGHIVHTLDRSSNLARLQLLLTEKQLAEIHFHQGDLSDPVQVFRLFDVIRPSRVIHLAALQLPFCKNDPIAGAQVNVVGTVNIYEAVKKYGAHMLAFASSTAVYGTSEEYPEGALTHESTLKPRSHYGVYKQANEGTARVYWLEDQIPSIGLRPYTVYGSGRDQGMTSTPTKAMIAAVLKKPYHISFGGRCAFQYGRDIGEVFVRAVENRLHGAETFNIGGPSVSVADVIRTIEQVVPESRGTITFTDSPLPFPEDVDHTELEKVLGSLPVTPLEKGVEETIDIYSRALRDGILSREKMEAILQ